MVKFFFILRRKPGLSSEEFHRYWEEVHGPIVSRLPGLVRYFQHHVVSVPRPEYAQEDAPIDGIVETWWKSAEALEQVKTTPELQAVIADEPNFMGHSNHHVHTLHVFKTVELVNTIPTT